MRRASAFLVIAMLVPLAAAITRTRRRREVWHTLADHRDEPADGTRGP